MSLQRWVKLRLAFLLLVVVSGLLTLFWSRPGYDGNLQRPKWGATGQVSPPAAELASINEIPSPEETPPPPKEFPPEEQPPLKPQKIYKNITTKPVLPIKESFPIAAAAKSASDLPPVPWWNKPPATHVPEKTPLFIGFTRNWPLLQQTVVGYITAGWPPEDIYVVENTGVMDANKRGRLTLPNPFYLDHRRLIDIFGVNVIVMPSLQSFAQIQNFYLSYSIEHDWPQYFWSHMDIVPLSFEDQEPHRSLYLRCVDAMREIDTLTSGSGERWALRFFAYDWLTLQNVAALADLGGWDSMIAYYTADCDMYDRMRMAGMRLDTASAGVIWDVGEPLEDLMILYRRMPPGGGQWYFEDNATAEAESQDPPPKRSTALHAIGEADEKNSTHWHALQSKLEAMQQDKVHGDLHRNIWQERQNGGQGEPYYRDIVGFKEALEIIIKAGIRVYEAKWGGEGCNLIAKGLELEDAWKIAEFEDVPA